MRVVEDAEPVFLTMFEHARTEKAILVSETGDKGKAVWLPLSQIGVRNTDNAAIREIECPEWLAVKSGLV